jgi:hypothetical protein
MLFRMHKLPATTGTSGGKLQDQDLHKAQFKTNFWLGATAPTGGQATVVAVSMAVPDSRLIRAFDALDESKLWWNHFTVFLRASLGSSMDTSIPECTLWVNKVRAGHKEKQAGRPSIPT